MVDKPVAAVLVLGVSFAAGMALLVSDETNQQENNLTPKDKLIPDVAVCLFSYM